MAVIQTLITQIAAVIILLIIIWEQDTIIITIPICTQIIRLAMVIMAVAILTMETIQPQIVIIQEEPAHIILHQQTILLQGLMAIQTVAVAEIMQTQMAGGIIQLQDPDHHPVLPATAAVAEEALAVLPAAQAPEEDKINI